MYKEIFKNIKEHELRLMSTGWTRYYPYNNFLESHPINDEKYNSSTADVYMRFGDHLDKVLRLRCECKQKDGYGICRFKLDEVESDGNHLKSQVSIQVVEKIKTINIYETYDYEGIGTLNTDEYFPSGILMEFQSGNFLGIWGQEGDDQYEPCQYLKFIQSNEIEIFKTEWINNWKKFEQIDILEN